MFAVLHNAIVASGKVALSRVVISRRERVVAIVPMGRGLDAHTLYEERDLNSAADVFDKIPQAKPDPEMVKLATMLIDRQTGTYDPADVVDRYEQQMICPHALGPAWDFSSLSPFPVVTGTSTCLNRCTSPDGRFGDGAGRMSGGNVNGAADASLRLRLSRAVGAATMPCKICCP